MTANYDMIKKVYSNYKSRLSEVRKVVNRPLTYAEKVLYTHLYDKAAKEFSGGKDYVDLARERILSYFDGTLGYRQLGTPVYQPTGKDSVSKIPDEWKSSYQQNQLLDGQGEYKK